MLDKEGFRRGVARLKAMGHEVEIDQDALARSTRFAGDDETRLAAIHRAAASGADVAMISRGGYGLSRILGGIKYKAVAKAVEKGTHFVGQSDFTAFQSALLAKTGATSWSGPSLIADLGVEGDRGRFPRAARGHRAIAAGRADHRRTGSAADIDPLALVRGHAMHDHRDRHPVLGCRRTAVPPQRSARDARA